MSITQTYFLAHTARGKLSSEAARSDHDLRLLVGHANLLDSLTVDLQEAEREQDAWFERTVAEARKPSEPKRVQWTDRPASVSVRDLEIPDGEDDEDDSDADSDVDSDDEAVYAEADAVTMTSPSRRAKSPPPMIIDADSEEEDEDEDMYDDDEVDNQDLSLTRVASRPTWASISPPPPELVPDHSDCSSDEEEEESESDEEDSQPTLPIQPIIAPKDFSHPSSQPHGFLEQRTVPAVAAY